MAFLMDKKYKKYKNEGDSKEKSFAELISKHGYNSTISSIQQDIKEHWDLEIFKSYKVDIKGLKKIRRNDISPQEDYHYIEIKNIGGGEGWCYSKEPNLLFAFETFDYWVLVKKEDLQNLIKEKVQKEWTKSPTPYKLYRREGRKDAMTLVKTIDLLFISFFKFKK